MGYQNQERPKKLNYLLTDAQMDLTDLIDDIEHDIDKEKLVNSVLFIKGTIAKIEKSFKKLDKKKLNAKQNKKSSK